MNEKKIFPQFAPKQYPCKKCGKYPLEIVALTYEVKNIKTKRKKILAEPVLICHSHFGCGSVFSLEEYGLTEEMILI